MPHISREAGRSLVRLILIGMAVQLIVIFYVGWESYAGRVNLVKSQRAGCERGKLDRTDNADFQRAHTKYITSVTDAASVKEDVKSAAREAVQTFRRTSEELTQRAHIICADVYPKASLLP